ncbi:MAG: ABC transporter substrate-binding protein [Frankiaceae bacterium]|jgi:oligopeptide transport system substrate-binding protein|nr:ABC transporter substrate-binding protein [Frankiaceae bacterium]
MKRTRLSRGAVAAVATLALTLAACSSGGGKGTPSGTGGASSGIVSYASNEPENPLIPADTNEVGGGLALQNIFAMPVYYQADGSTAMDAAESITSSDNTLWTIKLKAGQKFSDGSAVDAQSFVDAWQYGASDPTFLNQYWFANFQGYQDDPGPDAKNPKTYPNSLALTVVDATTFTAQLASPQSDFVTTLGYTAFAPLPQAFFADSKTFGQKPIGNGPYQLDKWVHDQAISLKPNPNYDGPRKAQNGGIELRAYQTQDAAYADLLSNNLDLVQQVPETALGSYKGDLGNRAVDQAAAIWQGFTIPTTLAHFSGDEGKLRRAAISYAINRADVASKIFNNTRTPAVDFTSPVLAGFNGNIQGSEVTHFDAQKAKDLWAQADAISKWDGKFQLAYNSDGNHQAWVDAVMNQLKNTLGIDAAGKPYPDFASLRKDVNARSIGAASRAGWQFDYPGASNILGAMYVTGAGSNDGDYSDPAFDDLYKKGVTAKTVDEANRDFEQAQQVLFQDLPTIPLFYSSVNAGYSTLVQNVKYGWDSWPILYQVTKN